jgi:hypothetical protein
MTANESAWALAEALQTDLVFRLDLLHDAEAPKLDLALQMAQAEQGAAAEEMVPELHDRLFPTADRLALSCAAEGPFPFSVGTSNVRTGHSGIKRRRNLLE